MTQREQLIRALATMVKREGYYFLYRFLEEINYHNPAEHFYTEYNRICKLLKEYTGEVLEIYPEEILSRYASFFANIWEYGIDDSFKSKNDEELIKELEELMEEVNKVRII